jgi:hypothetical protein
MYKSTWYYNQKANIDTFTAMRTSILNIKGDYQYGPYVFMADVSFYILLKVLQEHSTLRNKNKTNATLKWQIM